MEEDVKTDRAADLRRAFDRGFSEPPGEAEETEPLLAIRTGGAACSVRLADIAGLFVDRRIVRLPSPVPEFLGVSALRRDVVPVFSLRALLGYAADEVLPRWLVVARAAHVAFAFEQFEGYLRVPPSAILAPASDGARKHVPSIVRLAGGTRGVVSIGSLLKTIRASEPAGMSKEQ